MNYALLVSLAAGALKGLSSDDKRSLHGAHQSASAGGAVSVIAHYRLRPARLTATVHSDRIEKTRDAAERTREDLRAIYVLESDDPDAVLDFAGRLPAVRLGGAVEVCPLIAPGEQSESRHGHRASRRPH